MKHWRLLTLITILCIGIAFFIDVLITESPILPVKTYGMTFSKYYAHEFAGVDWRQEYLAILNDLKVKHLRIPAYWTEVEPKKGEWNFIDLDWQIEQAKNAQTDVILAVGRKLPRWPECFIPEWAGSRDKFDEEAFMSYLHTVIDRFKQDPTISSWQIENEPFLHFGDCGTTDASIIDREINLVSTLDARPIVVTDSGELSFWVKAAERGSVFGTTMYRSIWSDRWNRQIDYPLPPAFFRVKRSLTKLFITQPEKPMIVIELQGESWLHKGSYETTVAEQYASFDPQKFKDTLVYASKTSFDTFYLWGVEWWWWLKETQHRPEMWNIAKEAIQKTNGK